MKNRSIGLFFALTDVMCVLPTFFVVQLSLKNNPEIIEFLLVPLFANMPAILLVRPLLGFYPGDSIAWLPLLLGLLLGCVQYYFVGWNIAWLLKQRKKKLPYYWNRVLLVILFLWSVGVSIYLLLCFFFGWGGLVDYVFSFIRK